jgi:hypothetical protein
MLWCGRLINGTPAAILSQITTSLSSTNGRHVIDTKSEALSHLDRAARLLVAYASDALSPPNLEALFSTAPIEAQHTHAVMVVFEAVADEMVSLARGSKAAAEIALYLYKRAEQVHEGYPILRVR